MPEDLPTPYQKKTLWNALTGVAIVVIGALFVGFIWLLSQTLGYLQPVLVPLALAGIIAYLLDPVVGYLQRRGLSTLRAVITVFCGAVILLCLAALVVIPPIANQVGEVWTGAGGIEVDEEFIEKVKDYPVVRIAFEPASEVIAAKYASIGAPVPWPETRLGSLLNKNAAEIGGTVWSWVRGSTNKVLGVLGYTIGFAMVPIYLFYFLRESASIKKHWHNYVPLKASRFKDEVVSTLTEINGYLISFFRGQVVVALIDGILIGIALTIFRLPYGLVIGLFLAVLGVIPFIGNIICMIPACIIAFIHFSSGDPNHQWLGSSPWAYVGAVVAIFVIVQQINSLITAPKIVGDSVGLHPMTVIFSMLFWSLILGGFLGALLAVPLTAAVKVLFRRYVWVRRIQDELPPRPDDPAAGAPA
ncbi:MAG: AI-2E family transporter [Akkermansiaceae bacterium]|nr:AI-2E family transporter [Akkermansiaceae bacterium]